MIKMLNNQILVKKESAEQTLASGLVIPDVNYKQTKGIALSVGPGKRDADGTLIPLNVKVGDTILFGDWVKQTIKHDGVEYLVVREEDLFGVIEAEEKAD